LQNRAPKQALEIAQAANTAIPNEARILDYLGLAQLASGETGQAIESFNKLAALMPESPLPLMRLASAQYAAKQVDAPLLALRKALVLKPDLLEARREIIAVQLAAGRTDEALKETKALQQARPKEAVGYTMEGDVLASQKRYTEAASAYAEGMKRQPSSDLVVKQYRLLRESGKSAEAAAIAAKWMKDHPDDSIVRFSMATEAAQTSDYKGAVERFGAILALQPNNAAVLNNMAWVLNEMKDSAAIGYAEKAYAQAPENPEIQDTYGWLMVESGNTKRGIEILSKAVEAAPGATDIRMHLAKAYLKSGDQASAKRELETITRTGNAKAKEEAAKLLKAQ
jgi:putative PEP-CTERM system TPR-repeat lipoprotein